MSDILIGKLATEFKTVKAMVEVYCKDHHGTRHHDGDGLCVECRELLEYAEVRLDRCPYGEDKPTCNKCPIHCYKPEPKEQMRLVMRYSGPRMLLKHPILAIRHLVHEKRSVPEKPIANASNRHRRMNK
ncbi:nitrous oxide-stimulated promoter family protein [Vibrio alfacsensis]|uniref:Nitrous oxide-stimulated promoter family protein n=1 Tax=Vibrio alfacsensis TaxID=1074311 RepID=A0ABM6YZ77_9VIBR|nr:nitrous oxide-stimulated promoter family protein [Vibrio alfacsensis]AXY03046.1 nitrous oxide-stimulated promoter family protein [Vibrio alfacsensis]